VSSASPIAYTASALPDDVNAGSSIACRFQGRNHGLMNAMLADNSGGVS
jgi:hypothetical protein